MKIFSLISLVLMVVYVMPYSALAGDFDGSKPLLCSVISVVECTPGGECERGSAEDFDISQFLRIDFEKKTITGTSGSGVARTTGIERMEPVDGKLILQGAEDGVEDVRDGLGWSMAISEETGKMVLSASGDEVGFVIFGACTPH